MDHYEIISRLRELSRLKVGDPFPPWLSQNNWGPALSELCRDAANLIVTDLALTTGWNAQSARHAIEQAIIDYMTACGATYNSDTGILDTRTITDAVSPSSMRVEIELAVGRL